MGIMKKSGCLLAVLFLCGCATGISTTKYNDLPATPDRFSICHGYSCTHKSEAGFSKTEWAAIAAIFKKAPAHTASAERVKIGKALALMERYTGQKTGTSEDLPMAKTIKESAHQMDCIDETVNTTQYLDLLQQKSLLKFHQKTEPTHRGYFIDGSWPHNTAVIREKPSGALWVVDSFYRANGQEPYILPRSDWLAGWKPPGAKQ